VTGKLSVLKHKGQREKSLRTPKNTWKRTTRDSQTLKRKQRGFPDKQEKRKRRKQESQSMSWSDNEARKDGLIFQSSRKPARTQVESRRAHGGNRLGVGRCGGEQRLDWGIKPVKRAGANLGGGRLNLKVRRGSIHEDLHRVLLEVKGVSVKQGKRKNET